MPFDAPNLVHKKTGVNSIYLLQYKINCPHTDMMENFLIFFSTASGHFSCKRGLL
jgi:hypothetical protein